MSRGNSDGKSIVPKIAMLLLLSVVLVAVFSIPAEAAVKDSLRSFWSQISVFVKSWQFWVNAFIVFAGLFLLYTITLSEKAGSDTGKKVIIYIIIILAAVILSTKIVDDSGHPEKIWSNERFRGFTQFLIGPATPVGQCGTTDEPSAWKNFIGSNPNPPCCGTGVYQKTVGGKLPCKQAILRTNESGAGMPAFLIASILFFLLFSSMGDKLNFKSMGGKAGEWFPIVLSVLLGALMANERITKSNVIMIGGWVAVLMIGKSLSKSLSDEKDEKGTKKFLGFALAFAFVQLIANMLGTSLFGGEVTAEDIGAPRILKNLFWGMVIGGAYSILNGGGGILGDLRKNLKDKQREDIKREVNDGKFWRAFGRSLPIIGRFIKPKKAAAENQGRENALMAQINTIAREIETERASPHPNIGRMRVLERRMNQLVDSLIQREAAAAQQQQQAAAQAQGAQPQAQPGQPAPVPQPAPPAGMPPTP
jgi:Flp pilus assembly pilin Flp